MGLLNTIKNAILSFFRLAPPKAEKPIDERFLKSFVNYWNKQTFPTSKYGYKLKPAPKSLRKVNLDKFPGVGHIRPTVSTADKAILTLVEINGFDRKTRKNKKVKFWVGSDKILTPREIKHRILDNPKIVDEILPDVYDVVVEDEEDITLITSYFNLSLDDYQYLMDELNPAYFE